MFCTVDLFFFLNKFDVYIVSLFECLDVTRIFYAETKSYYVVPNS